ncbi:MAG: glycosyltransferase [Planctomycetia bacterium]|nr:glycosyltransferase [Planctomycetia bacterium]
MDHPIISIIMPVYNAAEFLREALDSVLNQTFSDLELICVDDGSTDSSGAILDEYARRDARLRVMHQANAGAAAARNAGLDLARGEVVAFVDSDDVLSLEMCEKAYAFYKETGAEIVLFGLQKMTEEGTLLDEFERITKPQDSHAAAKARLAGSVAYGKLFSLEMLKRCHIRFDEGRAVGEDNLFALESALVANEVAVVRDVLYFYRRRSGSLSNTKCVASIESHVDLLNAIQTYPTTDDVKTIFEEFQLTFIMSYWEGMPTTLKRKSGKRIGRDFPAEVWRKLREWKYEIPVWYRYFFLSFHGGLWNRWSMYFKYLFARYLKV